MNNALYIRSFLVDSHVHFDLGRRSEALVSLDNLTVCIYLTDVLGGHEALGHARGSAEELVVADLYGDVTVVGRNHSLVVNSLTDFTDLLFDFILCHCFVLLTIKIFCVFFIFSLLYNTDTILSYHYLHSLSIVF